MTARSPQHERLLELLDPVIAAEGYDLEELSVTAAGRRSVVRIIVDADGGIDLDAVADVSRAVSRALDDQDAELETAQQSVRRAGAAARATQFTGPYVLEVSSPGVDRPLTQPRHWRRATGRLVTVLTDSGETLTGRVRSADDAQVVLDIDGLERALPLTDLGPGRVQVEFARAGDTGPEATDGESDVDDVGEEEA
jgi:ribosome maturation factor RimP